MTRLKAMICGFAFGRDKTPMSIFHNAAQSRLTTPVLAASFRQNRRATGPQYRAALNSDLLSTALRRQTVGNRHLEADVHRATLCKRRATGQGRATCAAAPPAMICLPKA